MELIQLNSGVKFAFRKTHVVVLESYDISYPVVLVTAGLGEVNIGATRCEKEASKDYATIEGGKH